MRAYSRNFTLHVGNYDEDAHATLFLGMEIGTHYNNSFGFEVIPQRLMFDASIQLNKDMGAEGSIPPHNGHIRIILYQGPRKAEVKDVIADGIGQTRDTDTVDARSFVSPWMEEDIQILYDRIVDYNVSGLFENGYAQPGTHTDYEGTSTIGMRRFFIDDYVAGEQNPGWSDNTNLYQYTYGQPVTPYNWRPYYQSAKNLAGNATTDTIEGAMEHLPFTAKQGLPLQVTPMKWHLRENMDISKIATPTLFKQGLDGKFYGATGDIRILIMYYCSSETAAIDVEIKIKSRVYFK